MKKSNSMKVRIVVVKKDFPIGQDDPGKQESELLIPQSPWPAALGHQRLFPFTLRYPTNLISPSAVCHIRAEQHRWDRKQARGETGREDLSVVPFNWQILKQSTRTLPLEGTAQSIKVPWPLTSWCDYRGSTSSPKLWIKNRIKHHLKVCSFLHNF